MALEAQTVDTVGSLTPDQLGTSYNVIANTPQQLALADDTAAVAQSNAPQVGKPTSLLPQPVASTQPAAAPAAAPAAKPTVVTPPAQPKPPATPPAEKPTQEAVVRPPDTKPAPPAAPEKRDPTQGAVLSLDGNMEKYAAPVVQHIIKSEGGGMYVLYGGGKYDPRTQPQMPGYYGFPQWDGGTGPDGRKTHAAGPLQWEPDTWKTAVDDMIAEGLADRRHPPDFNNVRDNLRVGEYWASKRYAELTGRDLAEDSKNDTVNYAALGPEWPSLKGQYTAGNLPSQAEFDRLTKERVAALKAENDTLREGLKTLTAGSPEEQAMKMKILKNVDEMMDQERIRMMHPPTRTPVDSLKNFGSLATLLAIFAGRFSGAPLTASLSAAGAAMQAVNDRNEQDYLSAFNTWKTQSTMAHDIIGMEVNAYNMVLNNEKQNFDIMREKLEVAAKIHGNDAMVAELQAGNYEGAIKRAKDIADMNDQIARTQKETIEYHDLQRADQERDAVVSDNLNRWEVAYQKTNNRPPSLPEIRQARRRFELQARQEENQVKKAPTPGLEREEAINQAVAQLDRDWLNDPKKNTQNLTEVPESVHWDNWKQAHTEATETTAGGMRFKYDPKLQGFKTFLDEKAAKGEKVTSKDISDWVQKSTPRYARSGMTMAVQKFIEANPNATPEQIIGFMAEAQNEIKSVAAFGGGGTRGALVTSLDVAESHINTLRKAADALNNRDVTALNAIKNVISRQFGGASVTDFNSAKQLVAAEINKATRGSGTGTGEERESLARQLDAANSPEQLEGVLETFEALLAGQMRGLKQQYEVNTERKDFESKLSPNAAALLKKYPEAFQPADDITDKDVPGTPENAAAKAATMPTWATRDPSGVQPQIGGRDIFLDPSANGGKGGWFFADHTSAGQ